MIIIGLCGRSGSGKSECSRFIEEMGVAVLDSDMVYRELTVSGSILLLELCGFFGAEILDWQGELDRIRLSELVFGDDVLLGNLNRITHKHIMREIVKQGQIMSHSSRGGLVAVQAPLLFESGFDKQCAFTACVIADDESCVKRLKERDGLTEEQAMLRLSKQKDNAFLQSNCDYSILNDADVETLRERTEHVLNSILGKINHDKD